MLRLIFRATAGSLCFLIVLILIQIITTIAVAGLKDDGNATNECLLFWLHIYKFALEDFRDIIDQFSYSKMDFPPNCLCTFTSFFRSFTYHHTIEHSEPSDHKPMRDLCRPQ